MSILKSVGIDRIRMDKILANIRAKFKDTYGQDLNLEESTPDGQIVGVLSEVISSLNEGVQAIYDNFNPNSSTGIYLDELVKLNGIARIPKTPTNVILDLTIDTGGIEEIIPAPVYINSPDGNNQYVIISDIFAPVGGTIQVYAEATEYDTPIVPENTLTVVETSTGFSIICNNPKPSVLGREEETDAQLRARRFIDSSFSGDSSTDKLYKKLISMDKTRDAIVYENDNTGSDHNALANSLAIIVRPISGLSNDELVLWREEVANNIFKNITVGVGTNTTYFPNKKTIVVTSRQGFTSIIYFVEATEVTVDVVVNVTELDGFPTNGDELIKQEIINYVNENPDRYRLDSLIVTRELYIPCHRVPGHSITSITTDIGGGATSADKNLLDYQAPYFDIANITVNVT